MTLVHQHTGRPGAAADYAVGQFGRAAGRDRPDVGGVARALGAVDQPSMDGGRCAVDGRVVGW